MHYLKFVAILLIGINTINCSATKQTVEAKEETPIIETITETQIEVVEEVTVTEEVEVEIKKPTAETDSTLFITHGKFVISHSTWNELLQKQVSDQGNVNYKGFKADKTKFYAYLDILSKNPPEASWSKDETLAYWMNAYNAFTVKLILDNYPTKSIKDIDGPWNQRFIKIGEKWYTLNDVEHKIIRKMGEPRIHFALVCAAVSCPRLYNKAFTAANLEADLDVLTRGFLNDPSKNEFGTDHIKLSRIFKWYGGDFKTEDQSLIDFLNLYTDVTISARAKKSYKDYNWNLNE